MRKKLIFQAGVAFFVLIFSFPLSAFSSCEEDCEVPKSCKEYIECRANQLQCFAACKQKEAWELYAQASEKVTEAQERMIEVLKEITLISQKTVQLLDKMIMKMEQEKEAEEENLL
jgi:hypothetical protein